MKDWRGIANAADLGIPARDIDRILEPLNALESVFRPLLADLTPDVEPAAAYRQEDHE